MTAPTRGTVAGTGIDLGNGTGVRVVTDGVMNFVNATDGRAGAWRLVQLLAGITGPTPQGLADGWIFDAIDAHAARWVMPGGACFVVIDRRHVFTADEFATWLTEGRPGVEVVETIAVDVQGLLRWRASREVRA